MIYQQQGGGDWIQIGISSFFSSKGCQSGEPSGFTRVSSYRSWIESITGSLPLPTTTTSTSASSTTTKTSTAPSTIFQCSPSGGRIQNSAHLLLSAIAGLFIIITH